MKIYRSSKGLLLLAACAISVASVQDASLLRRVLKANDKQSYDIVTDTHINADTPVGAQEGSFKSTGKIETSTGAVKSDGSTAEYTMVTTVDHLDADGVVAMGKMPDKIPPVTIKGKIDAQNRITESKLVGDSAAGKAPMSMLGGSEASQVGLFVTFPAGPIKTGDTWPVTVPGSAMNKQDQTLTAKLVGTQDVKGKKVFVVALTGQLVIDPDPAAMKQAAGDQAMNMNIKIKGTTDVSSEILIDLATGETVQATSKIKGKVDVEIVELSTTFHATSDTSVKMTKAD